MKLTRRGIFPLAAVGAVAASDAGASISPHGAPGIDIKIAKIWGGWHVLVPDWESLSEHWVPGMSMPTKWIPVKDYLQLLDETYKAS